jgi:hypothetical protein
MWDIVEIALGVWLASVWNKIIGISVRNEYMSRNSWCFSFVKSSSVLKSHITLCHNKWAGDKQMYLEPNYYGSNSHKVSGSLLLTIWPSIQRSATTRLNQANADGSSTFFQCATMAVGESCQY